MSIKLDPLVFVPPPFPASFFLLSSPVFVFLLAPFVWDYECTLVYCFTARTIFVPIMEAQTAVSCPDIVVDVVCEIRSALSYCFVVTLAC